MITLACLYYEVRQRFYSVNINTYMLACQEINYMANKAGYTLNDLAKILIIKP